MDKIGQYFTEDGGLQMTVLRLCKNKGTYLEPSAGKGHLVRALETRADYIVAMDLDTTLEDKLCKNPIIKMDFFDFPISNKFDTVFGNPPFLKHTALPVELKVNMEKDSILQNCNIFYNFIEKSFYHLNSGGEIVFIIPREFTNSTRAVPLREMLYKKGTITDFIDYEEQKLFKDAAPNLVIIRYEKGNHTHITNYVRGNKESSVKEILHEGSYLFIDEEKCSNRTSLSEHFTIKIGMVSACNEVFQKDTNLSIDMICSDYLQKGKKQKYIYVDKYTLDEVKQKDEAVYYYLLAHKDMLKSRGIKPFNDNNYHHFGAPRSVKLMEKEGRCIYVNAKARVQDPFFIDSVDYFDGSMIALFPKDTNTDLDDWCNYLNNSEDSFREQGLLVNNKYMFAVKTLSDFIVDKSI